jgi:hypothetical protein
MAKIDEAKEVYTEYRELWKVEQVIRPNKYDCYVLCSMESETTEHEDGTMQVYMYLFDYNNDILYPVDDANAKYFGDKACLEEARKALEGSHTFWDDEQE